MSYHFWSDEETSLLIASIKRYNFDWEEVQFKTFPNLTIAQIKNKFYSNKQFKVLANQPITDYEKQLIRNSRQNVQNKPENVQQELNDQLNDFLNKINDYKEK
ncbi:Myb-like_DNA-binding domain-containing protein [Hexamita inflata]|uniref:Myb-like DNA-binding domain-containing protein n=1 Tax=Hexamita inflata TaxID=28002 RepID=A0AA86RCD4_9EUKA|nr:Myb-like DNA-binding domain-containing protein [Hexamita inflata]CAI9969829.1 Myb-like DNA-binding domain-containing protein [Hexamita inflata]CAI9971939.1 Myb-like DNA-binding domain-containing protein [Hexamita inflata]